MQDFRYSRYKISRHLDQESRFDKTGGISRDCNKEHVRNVTILYRRHHRLSAPTCARSFSRYYLVLSRSRYCTFPIRDDRFSFTRSTILT